MVAQIDNQYAKARLTKVPVRLLSYALFEGRPLTTKGRWINPFVFGLLWLQRRVPALLRVRKPIFIVGTGRSGTTVLGMVMSMHKSVGFLNEPKAIWHAAFGQEDLIGSYSQEAARYRLGAEDASDDVRRSMQRMYGWYLTTTCSNRAVDKYPELIFRIPFVRAIFPDAKFLFLVRNGWDTCHSIEHWSERLGMSEGEKRHDWWGVNNRKWNLLVDQVARDEPEFSNHLDELRVLRKHTDMAAVEWTLTMREGLRWQASHPEVVHTVQYERLASDPRTVLEEIRKFCELHPDDTFLDYGSRVLRPARPVQAFPLASVIDQPFRRTMAALGYEGSSAVV